MTAPDPYIQTLRDALIADHEARIAEVQGWADAAAQRATSTPPAATSNRSPASRPCVLGTSLRLDR
jgi:hypothetical protein